MKFDFSSLDLTVVILYFVLITLIGIWAGFKMKSSKASGNKYFLAGGTLTWPLIGLALFSTNISTVHLVSLAQEGYNNGLAYGNFEWMAAFILILLAIFFVPFYLKAKITTLPDFLEKRYNSKCRDWLAIMSVVSAIFIHIGFSLYTGAVVINGLLGVDIFLCIFIILVITSIYTIFGGLLAVVLTESMQTIILIAGAITMTAIAYVKLGGWHVLTQAVDPVKLTILRPHGDASGLPWYAILLGYPVIGIWYWCADQTIVQRVLGAKDSNQARVGVLFTGFLKILPVFIFVLPGLLCLALINQKILPDTIGNSANTYLFMIKNLLPVGVKGLIVATLLAALMSTVSGALNSIATLVSYDLFKRHNPALTDKKLIFIGRMATFAAMVLALIWSPLLSKFESIFQGINMMIGYIAPPITAVFIFGIFWKKASGKGALITLWSGAFLGFIVFILDWNKEYTNWNVPFMLTSFFLCVICSIILITSSKLLPDTDSVDRSSLTWDNPLDAFKEKGWRGIGNYKVLAITLFIVMILLYIIF